MWRTIATLSVRRLSTHNHVSHQENSSSSHQHSHNQLHDGMVTSGPIPMSFIEKARQMGAQAVVGKLAHRGGYDSSLADMIIEEMDTTAGIARARLPISRALTNSYGTLHGGCIATIVDVMGTLALLAHDPMRAGVSTNMVQTFTAPIRVGDVLLCEGRVLKAGKTLGFTAISLIRESDGKLVATGEHTKAL